MKRIDGRTAEQLRWIRVNKDYLAHPMASEKNENDRTKLICSVSCEPKVPAWMKAQHVPGGWLTCEYGMLPASTHDRAKREASSGKQSGRTMEIQRLIGRSLRSVIDLDVLGCNTLYIDCDVVDADGGTRCAGITGAAMALQLAMRTGFAKRNFSANPLKESIAAVSVGIVNGEPILDLCYEEDSRAEVDMNVVMTESGRFVEIQGTAEKQPFSRQQFYQLLDLAESGLQKIFDIQRKVLNGPQERTESNQNHAPRPKAGEALGSLGDAFADLKL